MKRIILSSLILTSLTYGASAARISSAEAMDAAVGFLARRGVTERELHPLTPHTRAAIPTADAGGNSAYHIFNIGEGDGFIIMAADDRLPGVIGYSTEGSISTDAMPEACKAWLEAHAEVLAHIPDDSPAKAIAYPSVAVAPLLTTKWDQTAPYNRQCPVDKATGRQTAAGCVATAVAQVMAHYRYPAQPSGLVEYDDKTQNEHRTFDFSAMAPIDWNVISDTYTRDSSQESCDAVAALINAVAHGSRMQFSSDTSTAYTYHAGQALADFFGYSPEMHFYERALVSDQRWTDIIVSELLAGRPVVYEGRNPSMGHAFVCDGYDGQGYFHINWGWSGLSDGYFSLSALTPPNQSTGGSESGYSLSQAILCNIAPEGTPGLKPQEEGLLNIDILYFRDSSAFHKATDNVSVSSPIADAQLFFYSFNKGLKPFSGEVCVAIDDAMPVSPAASVGVEELGSRNYTSVRFPLSDLHLPEGTHRLSFHYRTSPEGEWHPIATSAAGTPSGCYVTVAAQQATMSAVDPDIRPEMVEALSHSRLYANSTPTISFQLSNPGSARLEAHAGVAMLNADGEYVAFFSTPALCPAEDAVAVEVKAPLQGLAPGEYLLMPFWSYAAQPDSAAIKPLAYRPFQAIVEGVTLTPAGGSYFMIEPEKTSLDLSATNLAPFEWTAPVAVEIAAQDGSVVGTLPATEITLAPSVTAGIVFDCSSLTLPRGSYMARFMIAEETPIRLAELPLIATKDISSVSAVEADGIEISMDADITVTSPGSLFSVTLYDTSGRLIADIRPDGSSAVIPASGLPAGIYVLHVATESGKSATRKLRL